ncbi:MAG TPA: TonB family protein [Rhizomicrobium sp.]|jgi:protein TonB|nr:TonB family protein [Rhizomicrobium sp.]
MERPAHLLIQRPRQFTPRKIAAIAGAVVVDAVAIYVVATGLSFSVVRMIPHIVQAEVFQTPPPKVQPVILPPTQLVKPVTASVPPPEIQIQTPQPQPQITVAKMPPHPVMPAPVQTAAAPAPPSPPKPQGISAPVSIGGSHSCENEYPPSAQRLSQEGTTTIKFTVTTDGAVSDVQVVGSSGHDALDQAAIRCASSWRYKPALENGQPVPAPWTTNVQWKLQNGSTSM